MRVAVLLAALLYGAAGFSATPAFAADLTDAGRAELEAMRSGDMAKLAFHDAPKAPVTAHFANEAGNYVSFEDFEGRIALVNFWATWCPPCRKEMPAIDRLNAALAGDGIVVAAVNLERNGRSKARSFFDDTGIEHLKLYADETNAMGRALGILGLPVTILLDRQGREIARLMGDAEWDSPEAQALLRRLAELTEDANG